MVWYESMNPNKTTTLAMQHIEMGRVPQKGSTIEALTHRKWMNKSTGHK
jgi:(2Fe-2S) ferredoxin